jgi:integrase
MRLTKRIELFYALLIYERAGELHPYQRSAIDEHIRAVSERTGLTFTNHTLRQTLGRSCWLVGIPLETIKDLLGHEDTKTTIKYLGININDKSGTMSQLFKFQNAVKASNSDEARCFGGRAEISTHQTD